MKKVTKAAMKEMAKRGATALDGALIKAGKAAHKRQAIQARKAAMKKVGKVAAVAGAAAAAVVAARVVARNVRRGATLPD